MDTRCPTRGRTLRFGLENLESRQLMASRVSSSYILVDAWTSKPLSPVAAQIVKAAATNPHHATHHSRVHLSSSQAHPSLVVKPSSSSAPYQGALSPGQVRHTYGLDQSGLTGAGQTIAIIDAYDNPSIAGDLQAFSQQYGLPPANLLKAVPTSGRPRFDSGWAGEIALDVEWAHAMAPGATILLVEAKSASYKDLLSAVDFAVSFGAKQVSMSWGGTEQSGSTGRYDSHFRVPGVTFTAAAGDSGREVEHPAVSPYVTAVGGTTLHIDGLGNRLSETAWSGSGGGVSSFTPLPTYQANALSGNRRGVPDVAFNGDPNTGVSVFDSSSGGGWWQVGGTSEGAPAWAGILAVVNQGRASLRKKPLGTGSTYGTNQILYQVAGAGARTSISTDYYDVTAGSNGTPAQAGYDTVTGLGTPTAALINDLVNSVP